MGLVEMEKFISIIQEEKFDYTKFRKTLFNNLTGEEISKQAMDFLNDKKKKTTKTKGLNK